MEAEATLGSASALALSVINLRVSSASVTLPVHVLRTERRKYQIPKYYTSQKTSQGQPREFVLGRMPPVMEPPLNLTAVMTQMVGSTATACPCCNRSQEINHGNSNEYVAVAGEKGEPPIYIRTSEFDVSVKVGGIK